MSKITSVTIERIRLNKYYCVSSLFVIYLKWLHELENNKVQINLKIKLKEIVTDFILKKFL